jgi:hypothetical protein
MEFTAGYFMFFIPIRIVDSFPTANSNSAQIPVAARSETWVCGGSLARIPTSNPARYIDVCLSWMLCMLSGKILCDWLIARPTDCGVSECDRKASTIRRPWPTRNRCAVKNCELARLLVACLTVLLVIQHLTVGTADQFVCNLIVDYQYVIQHMHSVIHHLWYVSTATCFGTELPSSGSHYNTGI